MRNSLRQMDGRQDPRLHRDLWGSLRSGERFQKRKNWHEASSGLRLHAVIACSMGFNTTPGVSNIGWSGKHLTQREYDALSANARSEHPALPQAALWEFQVVGRAR